MCVVGFINIHSFRNHFVDVLWTFSTYSWTCESVHISDPPTALSNSGLSHLDDACLVTCIIDVFFSRKEKFHRRSAIFRLIDCIVERFDYWGDVKVNDPFKKTLYVKTLPWKYWLFPAKFTSYRLHRCKNELEHHSIYNENDKNFQNW